MQLICKIKVILEDEFDIVCWMNIESKAADDKFDEASVPWISDRHLLMDML
jgi:hypothetical protein